MNNLDDIKKFSISNNINVCEIDDLDCECKNDFHNSENENFNYICLEGVLVNELKVNLNNINIYDAKEYSFNFINFAFALFLIINFLIIKKIYKKVFYLLLIIKY